MKLKRILVTAAAVVGLVAVFGWLDLSSPSQCSGTPTNGDLQVGHIIVSRIVEREGPMMTVPATYPGHSVDELAAVRAWLDPYIGGKDQLVFAMQTFVVRTSRNLILVETGVGLGKQRDGAGGTAEPDYLVSLRRLGYAPEDVDFVVNTHLHMDHIGWNTRRRDGRWVPTFSKATYVFSRADWEYWKDKNDPTATVEENIRPLMSTNQALLVDSDQQLDSETRLELVPGHTPGHFILHLESQGQHAVIAGDMFHHPLQVAFPDWAPQFDVDPVKAREARISFLRKYADTETLVIPSHFPGPVGGYIVTDETVWRWKHGKP